MKLNNWKFEREADGVAWAILDTANSSTNTLGAEVMTELGLILEECEKNPPKGLIFKSAKEAGFIAGANIEEFTTADTPQKARILIQRGWDAYNRLAAVKYPTLALVRGHCMGGGTELALACTPTRKARACSTSGSTAASNWSTRCWNSSAAK